MNLIGLTNLADANLKRVKTSSSFDGTSSFAGHVPITNANGLFTRMAFGTALVASTIPVDIGDGIKLGVLSGSDSQRLKFNSELNYFDGFSTNIRAYTNNGAGVAALSMTLAHNAATFPALVSATTVTTGNVTVNTNGIFRNTGSGRGNILFNIAGFMDHDFGVPFVLAGENNIIRLGRNTNVSAANVEIRIHTFAGTTAQSLTIFPKTGNIIALLAGQITRVGELQTLDSVARITSTGAGVFTQVTAGGALRVDTNGYFFPVKFAGSIGTTEPNGSFYVYNSGGSPEVLSLIYRNTNGDIYEASLTKV